MDVKQKNNQPNSQQKESINEQLTDLELTAVVGGADSAGAYTQKKDDTNLSTANEQKSTK